MFTCLEKRIKIIVSRSKMELKHVLFYLTFLILIVSSVSLKVIFAKNTTAEAVRKAHDKLLEEARNGQAEMGTIINVPNNCKPGFVFESTFHNRCRRIAG